MTTKLTGVLLKTFTAIKPIDDAPGGVKHTFLKTLPSR
jgi:hypothetical protein